jgi:hypothetical protein
MTKKKNTHFYCVKCRKVTATRNIQLTLTKNGRLLKRGKCMVCYNIKTQFTKNRQSGGGLLNRVINKLPFEMHLPGHNFTGPGTNLNKRLASDLKPKSWSLPINRVDKAAYHHDICYLKNKDATTRNRICDKTMLKDLDNIADPNLRERIERSIVKKIIGTKVKFGM